MGKLFGTDGARGVAGKDLTPELAMQIGRAAAAVLAGLKDSTGDLELANSKAVSYKDARECIARFLEKNQSVVCRDLKGVETGKVLRACPDCISDAVEIIGEVLF